MGFDFMGFHVWDFSKPFGYFEAFSGIIVVFLCAGIALGLVKHFRPPKI